MLLIIGDMYENRTDSVKRLPTAAEYLWNPYRVFSF
jgi:predicted MPP superfamily phosphohydrolase